MKSTCYGNRVDVNKHNIKKYDDKISTKLVKKTIAYIIRPLIHIIHFFT